MVLKGSTSEVEDEEADDAPPGDDGLWVGDTVIGAREGFRVGSSVGLIDGLRDGSSLGT